MTTSSNPATANIGIWVKQRAASDPDLPAIKQGEITLSSPFWMPPSHDAQRSSVLAVSRRAIEWR